MSADIRPACESLSKAIDQSSSSMCKGWLVDSNISCILLSMCMGSLVERVFSEAVLHAGEVGVHVFCDAMLKHAG